MRPRQEFSAKQKKEVREALKSAHSKEEYQRVQAVWLRMSMGLMAAEIGKIFGMHPGSIWRIHARFFPAMAARFSQETRTDGATRKNLTLSQKKRVSRRKSSGNRSAPIRLSARLMERLLR